MITNIDRFKPWELWQFEGLNEDIEDSYIEANKIIVSDCDGVLTDGNHFYTADGKLGKSFGSCDKEAIKFMIKCGWSFIFTTEDPTGYLITEKRMRDWGMKIYTDLSSLTLDLDKKWPKFCVLTPEERYSLVNDLIDRGVYTVYVGDSNSDAWIGSEASMFCTTGNATELANEMSHLRCSTKKIGGHGAFADILYKVHSFVGRNNKWSNQSEGQEYKLSKV